MPHVWWKLPDLKVIMPESNIRLLWRTDGHLSDHTPSSRTDVWSDTILGKIRQIGQLAKIHDCHAVLDGGDLFHEKTPIKTSHELMGRLFEIQRSYPCPIYGNVGNHDCRLGQFEFLQEGPLGSLFSSGVMKPCFNEHEAHFREDGVHVRVVGIPYHGPKYDLDRFRRIRKGIEDHLIVIVHLLMSPQGGDMFAGEDIVKYKDLLTLCPEASVIAAGHWHKDQGIVRQDHMQIVNIGSFSRGSLSQDNLDRIPSVALLRCFKDRVEVEQIPLQIEPPENIFDLQKRAVEELQTTIVDNFVRTLQTDLQTAPTQGFSEIVAGLSDAPAQVQERTLSYLERAR